MDKLIENQKLNILYRDMKLSRAIILLTLHLWYKWRSVICIQGTSEYFYSKNIDFKRVFSIASFINIIAFDLLNKKKYIFSNFYEHSSNFTSIEIILSLHDWEETFFMLITLLRRLGGMLGADKRWFELEAIIFSTDNVFNLIPLSRIFIDITVNVL